MLKTYLVVMLGGAAGTGLRMWLSGIFDSKYGDAFPVGTLVVNVLGCFVIGTFAALTGPEGLFTTAPLTRQMVTIGVLGGFTTFSSFGLQTFNLIAGGDWLRACLNAALSLVLCLLAVWIGHVTAGALSHR
jgi:CrcB protein